MFVKSFIYLAIIAIIAILNYPGLAQAKSYGKGIALSNADEAPEKPSQFESPVARMRRSIERQGAADEIDVPKDQFYAGSALRFRRETETGEPDAAKALQNERAKRQIPSPPEDMPMPPMGILA